MPQKHKRDKYRDKKVRKRQRQSRKREGETGRSLPGRMVALSEVTLLDSGETCTHL